MRTHLKIALITGALALSAAPAIAVAGQPSNQGTNHVHGPSSDSSGNGPNYSPTPPTPGPQAGLPAKAKAYGRYCQGESKQHVDGEKGTPFSQCVTAMAKAANNDNLSTSQACKGLSKKHVKGEKGTPFSRCVTAAAKLRGNHS